MHPEIQAYNEQQEPGHREVCDRLALAILGEALAAKGLDYKRG